VNTSGASVWAVRLIVALGVAVGVGCGDDDGGMDASTIDAGGNGGTSGNGGAGGMSGSGGSGGAAGGGACPTPAPNQPPETLSCAGMYSDIAAKTLAAGVREFAPGVALWSDGAEKTRWILLPSGQTINVANADAWQFPVGTKFFKEFKWKGKRVETRLFWKTGSSNPLSNWVRTAYKWNDAETEATRSGGEDIVVGGDAYHIPSTTECDQCHKGRLDRSLGFEAVLLGLPSATGVTLATLQSEGLLSGGTLPSNIAIGDDGTGRAAAALGWLHVNCGVSCHNGNPASEAFSTGLRLQLKTADANGGSVGAVDSIATAVSVDATTGRWLGRMRIAPGSSADSLLYSLLSTRNSQDMRDQMPPIASRVVPTEGAQLIRDWIDSMGAGSSDGGVDSGNDAAADPDAN